VPDVVGESEDDAGGIITGAGLTVGTVTTANSDTVPEGSVISQDPSAGDSVAPGTAVDLVVSLGAAPVQVPDVVGESEDDAGGIILAAGLTVGTVTTANSDTVPEGSVISQDPSATTFVEAGNTVDLVVSLGE
jgi:beta-lactam-binding protein with PASTA domain